MEFSRIRRHNRGESPSRNAIPSRGAKGGIAIEEPVDWMSKNCRKRFNNRASASHTVVIRAIFWSPYRRGVPASVTFRGEFKVRRDTRGDGKKRGSEIFQRRRPLPRWRAGHVCEGDHDAALIPSSAGTSTTRLWKSFGNVPRCRQRRKKRSKKPDRLVYFFKRCHATFAKRCSVRSNRDWVTSFALPCRISRRRSYRKIPIWVLNPEKRSHSRHPASRTYTSHILHFARSRIPHSHIHTRVRLSTTVYNLFMVHFGYH